MPSPSITPDTPLTAVRGVGPERAAQLAKLGVFKAGDLLTHRPRRYEDRRHMTAIRDLALGRAATVRGQVVAMGLKTYRQRSRSVFELVLDDGTARLHCRWWNLPFMQNYFEQGDEVFAFGSPASLRPRTIDHPETEVIDPGEDGSIHINRVTPIYPLTEGLPQRWLRALIWRVLGELVPDICELWPGLRLESSLTRAMAFQKLHFPDTIEEPERARRRLALDEFIGLQLELQRRRRNLETRARALPCGGDNRLMKPFLAALGYTLTGAQTRVLREVRADLSGRHPMRRLVQGDVGSGKTVVAACAALMALESGFNVALMAPTQILAEQHYRVFRQWLEPLGIAVELQTGSRKTSGGAGKSRRIETDRQAPARAADPTPRLVIGTHALVESGFHLERLGLVVIDEQHKFGVTQREKLVRKGAYPHLLVMTATPIPRTLGLTLYGDLDLSLIDEQPAGRGPVRTFLRAPEALPKVLEFLRQKLAEGRQAYIVYPRVEESDASQLKAVCAEVDRLRPRLAPFPLALLHGRLPSEEKDRVMDAFRHGETRVLVATSVIEVGVDVPNASVMVIENADRFGLAQLHQLRGRIGRGRREAYCILVAKAGSKDAGERLKILAKTSDGFLIAEADLQLRGPGELLGQQQSGLAPFRFGDLIRDIEIIEQARRLAAEWARRSSTASSEAD